MSSLVLELRQGDMMIVNGAPIRFRNQVGIELTAKANFLFGKQLMTPDMAHTPAKRIYFALQTAYIGDHDERIAGLQQAKQLIAEFCEATTSSLARECLGRALALVEEDQCYQALKLVRRVMRHEEVVMGLAAVTQFAKAAE
jgi:flagellar protein FlbT